MTHRNWILCLFVLCGCSRMTQFDELDERVEKIVSKADWDSLPLGIEVVHTPNPVPAPNEASSGGDWPFMWSFRTEVRAINDPLTIKAFLLLGWDGKWVLDRSQKKFNSGANNGNTFADWYGCPGSKIAPGHPAADPSNWAGSYSRKPFKQKWVYIGEDAAGKLWRGEGVVELKVE